MPHTTLAYMRDTPLTATTTMNHKQTPNTCPPPAAGRVRGRLTMIRSKILG